MTFDDDYMFFGVRLGVPLRVRCKDAGVEWPPPEFVQVVGGPISEPYFRRESYSQITDEQRATMTRVCRGASYVRVHGVPGPNPNHPV